MQRELLCALAPFPSLWNNPQAAQCTGWVICLEKHYCTRGQEQVVDRALLKYIILIKHKIFWGKKTNKQKTPQNNKQKSPENKKQKIIKNKKKLKTNKNIKSNNKQKTKSKKTKQQKPKKPWKTKIKKQNRTTKKTPTSPKKLKTQDYFISRYNKIMCVWTL